jgi:hypothetical protein
MASTSALEAGLAEADGAAEALGVGDGGVAVADGDGDGLVPQPAAMSKAATIRVTTMGGRIEDRGRGSNMPAIVARVAPTAR